MTFILTALAVVSVVVPSQSASAYIPVAILNLDDDEETEEVVDELCHMGSIFDFYEVYSEEEMLEDIASGKANTGFIFPENLIREGVSIRSTPKITVIMTPSSTLHYMSSEEIFMKLFPHFAYRIIIHNASSREQDFPAGYESTLREIFDSYLNDEGIYRLESLEQIEYNEINTTTKLAIPVYKFAGFFIWMAALIGALSFLNDCDNKLYLKMSKPGRVFIGLILITTHVLPIVLISIVSFLICSAEFSVIHVLIYSIAAILLAFFVAAVIVFVPSHSPKSNIFAAVLPTYLILSFLFGGVLINLSVYSPILRIVSMMFLPFYF
ncbi:MAG: ABC transporter permease [Clostridiales bacterium]|nr:ABC transporter permease [Clostridiales bacterium]